MKEDILKILNNSDWDNEYKFSLIERIIAVEKGKSVIEGINLMADKLKEQYKKKD